MVLFCFDYVILIKMFHNMPYKPIEKEKLEELEFDLPADYTKLTCPSCSGNILSDDININDKIAKCGSCHAIFPFHKEIKQLLASNTAKQEIIRPEGIDIFRFRDSMEVTIQQPLTVIEMVLFMLIPLWGLTVAIGFVKGIFLLLILSILLLLGSTVYGLVWYYRHKMHLTINQRFLTVKREPRKYIAEKAYAVEDIDQIYIAYTSLGLSILAIINGVNGQKHINLISNVSTISKAKYLEQEIEKYLGIEDRRVPEENIT